MTNERQVKARDAPMLLFEEMVRAFLNFYRTINDKTKAQCAQQGIPYQGIKSWSQPFRNWLSKNKTALKDVIRENKLCWKVIRPVYTRLRKEILGEF